LADTQPLAWSALRAALPPLDLDSCAEPPGLADYLAFYRLDTRQQFPQVDYRLGRINSAGEQLAVQLWRQPGEARGNLLLVHGYFDHVGLFGHLVRYGLGRGYNVVAFDLPGHGLSTGEQGVIDQFQRYGAAVLDLLNSVETLPGAWDVIAQSTGGAAVMDILSGADARPFRRIVLFAPLLRPRGWWWVSLAQRLLHGRRDGVRRGFAENSHDAGFLEFVRNDPLQAQFVSVAWVGALRGWLPVMLARSPCDVPLLVLQGDEDRTVAWKYNLKQIARLFPGATITMIAQGRHHLANESEPIRQQLFEAMDGWLLRP
jgi:lysophospholipase